MNTGFIILLVNARLTYSDSYLFRGKFEDFTPLWYRSVGNTIIITLALNVFTTPMVNLAW